MYNRTPYKGYHMLNKEKCRTCQYYCDKCVEMNNRVDTPHAERDALCFCCTHCTDGSCSYMMTGKPIEGSVYNQRTLKDGTINTNIRTCPGFERG